MEEAKLKIGITNITNKHLGKKTSPEFVDVLCYFTNHKNLIICRVGHWNSELKTWVINSDGTSRYYKEIIEWQPIPKMMKGSKRHIYSIAAALPSGELYIENK